MSAEQAFYEPRGETYAATELTRGPWSAEHQHAGPPAALVGREIERCSGIGEGPAERRVGRITFEILRPVPIAEMRVRASVERPGRRVDMVSAELRDEGGELLVAARGWRILREELELPSGLASEEPGAPVRAAGRAGGGGGQPAEPGTLEEAAEFFPTGQQVGYHTAMEYRFASGSFLEAGSATCWMRMRHPLVAGEEPTPLERVLIAADTGNGISAALDFRRWVFINVDLTVHLHRMPATEWVCLDSLTVPEPTGVGLADTMLFDERGPIGRAAQTLLVAPR